MPKVIGIIAVVLCVISAITVLTLQNKALKSELALEKRITAELSAHLSQSVANIELAKAEATKLSKLCQDEINASKELNLIVKKSIRASVDKPRFVGVSNQIEGSLRGEPAPFVIVDPPIVFASVNSEIINYEISKNIIDYLNIQFN